MPAHRAISRALYLAWLKRNERQLRARFTRDVAAGLAQANDADALFGTYAPQPAAPRGTPDGLADTPCLWAHVSHSEALPPLRALLWHIADLRPSLNFVVTLPAELATEWQGEMRDADFPPGCHVVPAPLENDAAIDGFLTRWAPSLCIWVGLDLRPGLMLRAKQSGAVMIAIDGPRNRVFRRGWHWFSGFSKTLFADFDHILAGDAVSAALRQRLGAPKSGIEVLGFLEDSAPALPVSERERAQWAARLGGRPVWLAAHITEAEEAIVLSAHKQALRRAHRLLLVIVPQDPGRIEPLRAACGEAGLTVIDRDQDDELDAQTHVCLAALDEDDDMGLWYRLAPISFLGQSLVPNVSGVDPFVAAALGSTIIHGPNVSAHRNAYARLTSAGASVLVRAPEALAGAVDGLLAPDRAALLAAAAWDVCSSGAGVADRLADLVIDYLAHFPIEIDRAAPPESAPPPTKTPTSKLGTQP